MCTCPCWETHGNTKETKTNTANGNGEPFLKKIGSGDPSTAADNTGATTLGCTTPEFGKSWKNMIKSNPRNLKFGDIKHYQMFGLLAIFSQNQHPRSSN